VLAAPTTGHLAVLGATLGNLTSLVDCNAGGEFAADPVRLSLCPRSPSTVARWHSVFQRGPSDGRACIRCCDTPAMAQHHHYDMRNSRASINQTRHCQCYGRMNHSYSCMMTLCLHARNRSQDSERRNPLISSHHLVSGCSERRPACDTRRAGFGIDWIRAFWVATLRAAPPLFGKNVCVRGRYKIFRFGIAPDRSAKP
jgi:hypothetical protein